MKEHNEAADLLRKLVRTVNASVRVRPLRDPGCGEHDIDERHLGCIDCARTAPPQDALAKVLDEAQRYLGQSG